MKTVSEHTCPQCGGETVQRDRHITVIHDPACPVLRNPPPHRRPAPPEEHIRCQPPSGCPAVAGGKTAGARAPGACPWRSGDIGASHPNMARVYDTWLGGRAGFTAGQARAGPARVSSQVSASARQGEAATLSVPVTGPGRRSRWPAARNGPASVEPAGTGAALAS